MQRSALRTVLYSAGTGSGARLIAAAGGVITLPVLMAHLGKLEYGVWVLMAQSVQLLRLSDLGVSNAVGRIVARYRGRNDPAAVRGVVRSAIRLLILSALAVLAVTLLLFRVMPALLRIPTPLQAEASELFLITGVALAVSLPFAAATGLIAGSQRYAFLDGTRTVGSLLSLSAILLAAATGQLTLRIVALISAATLLVPLALQAVLARRLLGTPLQSPETRGPGDVRELVGIGASTILVSSASYGYRQGITILVGVLGGTAAAGIYGALAGILTHISAILAQLPRSLLTLGSEIVARKQTRALREVNRVVVRLSVATGVFLIGGAALYGRAGLELLFARADWTAADFHAAATALVIMAVGLSLGLPQIAARSILQGIGYHWEVARRFALASLISVAVAAAALAAGAGVIGGGVGWAMAFVLQGVWLYPPLICRAVDDTPLDLLRHGYYRGILAASLPLLPLLALKALAPSDGWAGVLGGVALAVGGIGLAFLSILRAPRAVAGYDAAG